MIKNIKLINLAMLGIILRYTLVYFQNLEFIHLFFIILFPNKKLIKIVTID